MGTIFWPNWALVQADTRAVTIIDNTCNIEELIKWSLNFAAFHLFPDSILNTQIEYFLVFYDFMYVFFSHILFSTPLLNFLSVGEQYNPVAGWVDLQHGWEQCNKMAGWIDLQHGREQWNSMAAWVDLQHGRELWNPMTGWVDLQHGREQCNPTAGWVDLQDCTISRSFPQF